MEVTRYDGSRGAFRWIKDPGPQAIQRFERELRLLSDPRFSHPSIVEILAITSNPATAPWYVSRLGRPFADYWKEVRRELADDPEELVKRAIAVVRALAEGLAPLHSAGVVHRDIKPQNIVASFESPVRPVLIDFGLAYEPEAARITLIDEKVGNRRFSPDVMRTRMNSVPPWLDVFELSQFLIWLLNEQPDHTWPRPVDWRFVNFVQPLSQTTQLYLRAVISSCSEETIAPANAAQFLRLVDNYFTLGRTTQPPRGGADRVTAAIKAGEAERALAQAGDQQAIRAAYHAADALHSDVRSRLLEVVAGLQAEGIAVTLAADNSLAEVRDQAARAGRPYDADLLAFLCGTPKVGWLVSLQCSVRPPSNPRSSMDFFDVPNNVNPFIFRAISEPLPGVELWRANYTFTLERDSAVFWRNNLLAPIMHSELGIETLPKVTPEQVARIIQSLIEREDSWRRIQRLSPGS